MKNIFLPFLLVFTLISCSSSSENDEPKPSQKIVCRGAYYDNDKSLSEGITVDAARVAEITVKFNNVVTLANASAINLNGKSVSSPSYAGMEVKFPVSLAINTEYTLTIGAGAVALASDAKVTNDIYTVNFKTEKGFDQSNVAKSPVNKSATPEVVALYNKLYDNYGKKMFSGAMAGIAWDTRYVDFLHEQLGEYPAVIGFDYMHLVYSPANWIDYGDITPVKRFHDMGCIIQIQWHWNVPYSEANPNGSFSADKTTFNPANVLVEGSWENKVAVADVDKLAGYLKLLQDAKIPVLWRPFHEAAGDYKWGAWFWWGTQGTEVTKRLYHWLYDKLTNQYNLNNLIWVWTMCTSEEGKLAPIDKVKAAYPGDTYVDMVGVDLYPQQTLTDQSAQFNFVNNAVEGHKMVALTECGNLISPQSAYDNHALWSYFMQWYDLKDDKMGFFNYKGPDQWKQVMSSPLVISIK